MNQMNTLNPNKPNELLAGVPKDDSLKYYIETWGCQMNEEDSEKLAGMLKRMGYESTSFKNKADCIISIPAVSGKMRNSKCMAIWGC